MSSSFADLGVPADVVAALAANGITSAFAIQTDAVPPALAGHDLCGRAPTGSGKTLAFGIPLAVRVAKAKPFRPTALILVPTRELASQIESALKPLLAARHRRIGSFYGGVGFAPQRQALRKGCDVVVACPGRLADLVRRSYITLDDVGFVVVDEADRMADMGFLPEVRELLKMVRDDRQTLLFSATLDGAIDALVRDFQKNPVRCEVAGEDKLDDRTTHKFVEISRDGRIDATANLVTQHGSTIVFCRTRRGSDRVALQLSRAGVNAAVIHGGRSQQQRERALASFTAGRITALVATDVAARGIHVDDVGCVVHFDLPADAKDYVHRSGRTGRAGADGMVVSFVTDADRSAARSIRKQLGLGGTDDHGHDRPRTRRPAPRGQNASQSSRGQSNRGQSGHGQSPRGQGSQGGRGQHPRAKVRKRTRD